MFRDIFLAMEINVSLTYITAEHMTRTTAKDAPAVVLERLGLWGGAIRKQRVAMGITAEDLCERLSISRPTLRRMENGDPATTAVLYLSALNVLGLLGHAAPRLEGHLWESTSKLPRARTSDDWRDEYF